MAFPTTGILDNFDRVDEDPLSNGGLWTTISAGLTVSSNQAANKNLVGYTQATSYWNVSTFIDSEVYATTIAPDAAVSVYIGVRMNATETTGYKVEFSPAINGITLYTDPGESGVLLHVDQTISAGDSVGVTAIGTAITLYYKASGGSWVNKGSVTDSAYASGYLSFSIDNNTLHTGNRIDNFGGGTVKNVAMNLFQCTLNGATLFA